MRRSPLNFGAPDVPRFTCRPAASPREPETRGSASERGYDHEWSRLSKWHLKREPLCRICYFRGRRVAATLTNHTIPIRFRPDLRLDKGNLSSACKLCHDTVIRDLERAAEALGNVDVLMVWLKDPSTWPQGMAFQAKAFPRLLRDERKSED